jgi:hypothetical protein
MIILTYISDDDYDDHGVYVGVGPSERLEHVLESHSRFVYEHFFLVFVVMPLWPNDGNLEIPGLQGALSNYRNRES